MPKVTDKKTKVVSKTPSSKEETQPEDQKEDTSFGFYRFFQACSSALSKCYEAANNFYDYTKPRDGEINIPPSGMGM